MKKLIHCCTVFFGVMILGWIWIAAYAISLLPWPDNDPLGVWWGFPTVSTFAVIEFVWLAGFMFFLAGSIHYEE